MTRPMPGPPEDCYCRDGNATCDDCETYGYRYSWGLCPGCLLHNGRDLGAHKRLTDAECAAHYWQAEAYAFFLAADEDQDGQWIKWFDHKATWHRFSAYPHAPEES